MYAHRLPARAGWDWLRAGLALFRQQPWALMGLVMAQIVVAVIALIPGAGFIVMLAMPGLSCAFMYACRDIEQSRMVLPTLLIAAFREPGRGRDLWWLGLMYLGLVIAGSAVIVLATGGALATALEGGALTTADGDLPPAVQTAALIAVAWKIGLTLLFWFTPILVVWDRLSPAKALFFNLVALWHCKAAILVASSVAAILLIAVGAATDLVLTALGAPASMQVLISVPISAALLAIVNCATYVSYRQAFGTAPRS